MSRVGDLTLVHTLSRPTLSRRECRDNASPPDALVHDDCIRTRGSNTASETYFVVDIGRGKVLTTVEERQYFPAVDVTADVALPALPVKVTPGATGFVVSNPSDCGTISYRRGRP